MINYNVIEIQTGIIILLDKTYEECIDWIEKYGNIVDYTIQEHQQ